MPEAERKALVTIDGDGFIYRTSHDGRWVGEVIYEEILARYPLRFCASVIAGEAEYCAGEFSREIARAVFALPNVDAASHSWSHPHDWNQCADLKREIVDSATFINDELLPGGKRVAAFLWTGLCNPTAEALALVHGLGIGNMNGGSPEVPWHWNGRHVHFHSRAPNDWHFMNLDRLMRQPGNVSVYQTLKTHPGDLGTFDRVVDFWTANPGFPVHVYFHWYSAVRRDSLRALHRVLTWVSEQGFESVSVHDYIESVRPDRAKRGAVGLVIDDPYAQRHGIPPAKRKRRLPGLLDGLDRPGRVGGKSRCSRARCDGPDSSRQRRGR